MTSPTQRSLAHLRKLGYTVAIVERWNPYAKVRQDLFGFVDLLAIRPGEILAVQTTSAANVSKRRAKIATEPKAELWRQAGGKILLHGWAKKGPRGKRKVWTLNEESL